MITPNVEIAKQSVFFPVHDPPGDVGSVSKLRRTVDAPSRFVGLGVDQGADSWEILSVVLGNRILWDAIPHGVPARSFTAAGVENIAFDPVTGDDGKVTHVGKPGPYPLPSGLLETMEPIIVEVRRIGPGALNAVAFVERAGGLP